MTRDALISGLWLLNKMGFEKITDTGDWESFQQAIDEEETDKEDFDGLTREIAFYKQDPIQLKFHSRAFHYHAARKTPLGDWLRCCWHYRKFDWHAFNPANIEDDSGERGVSMGEQYRIIFAWDRLAEWAHESVDCTWQNSGNCGMADYRLVTGEGVQHEEAAPAKAQRDKLARDFTKLWVFNLEELNYQTLRRHTGGTYMKPEYELIYQTIIPNEYDYRPRKLRSKAIANGLSGRKKPQD